jgi:hypothetical protein
LDAVRWAVSLMVSAVGRALFFVHGMAERGLPSN